MVESDQQYADQFTCTETVLRVLPDAAVVSNLGVASWILARVDDRKRNFYMDGGMGGTTPTGLGLAVFTDTEVVVLEGDGSMLMSLGCLSVVGEYAPANLTIVIMNNGTYGTTGGQPSISSNTAFAEIAEGCGIHARTVDSDKTFETAFTKAVERDEPTLIDCVVEPITLGPPEDFVVYERSHSYLTHRFRKALVG